ncbi:MAG TPA: beta-propeller fold lactonase family protein [Candidatus Acidoferrum sp.]|nr:beta-propeller fold lactonase family protein [Candidatus Acidoferrum sp.]
MTRLFTAPLRNVLCCGIVFATLSALARQLPQAPEHQPPAQPNSASPITHNPATVILPGCRADGSVLLPNQWSLRPAGHQVPLGDFPVNIALHPGGRFAAVLHCGHGRHEIALVDIREARVVSRTPVPEAFYGLEFSHNGARLYCSGAADEVIRVFDFKDGSLAANASLRVREARQRGIPCGLALSRDERSLYVANVWGQSISLMDLAGRTNRVDILLSPTACGSSSAFEQTKAMDPELAAITKRARAPLDPTAPDAPFPYACRLDEKRRRLYVSLWGRSCVAVVDLNSNQVVARWATGQHPNEMVLNRSGHILFVANANHNTVTVLDTSTGKAVETLDASLSPNALPGSMPNSLALSPDDTRLFVANACNNNVAVFNVSTPGKSRSLGFIPVGWYPTSVRVTPDGKRLLVADAKGLCSKANPKGPQPTGPEQGTQFIKELFPGALSIIDLPSDKEFPAQLAAYTAQAYQCTPRPAAAAGPITLGNPVPIRPGTPTPIKYVIYVIKENRTYDQILGDLPQGNGDPGLCLFPDHVTPNHHKLAREFVLLDNFYVEAEVSAQGHEWSMGAYATDFVEKTWRFQYGHNGSGKYPFPSEGLFAIAEPANGYLWDRAREAGVSYRSYGEFIYPGKTAKDPNHTRVAALQGHFDPWYHCFDTNYRDVKRAERFLEELGRFEAEGDMPRLQIVRLPNDHTCGTLPGRWTPRALIADNDRGLGLLVDGVTHSKFWPQTAIFILEDDAQNGPDHVDAHRSMAFIVSPYARRHAVDSTMYSTSSVLHTIELILGLEPMSQFDAAATPAFNAFQPTPDLRPYDALPPNVDLDERNSPLAWGSRASRRMDFSREDAADDLVLNEIIWRSVHGADSPMPAPLHAAFVFARPSDQDDD